MTLRQLELFQAILETGRFTAAAQKLYVAQPSVSQQIRSLEDELGERLFLRGKNRNIQVTEAGRILKDHADSILRQCQKARMEISALSKDPVGEIRIGIGGHQLTSMLPAAINAFHKSFPKVRVDILNGTTPQLVEMLKANRLDLGVVNFPISAPELRTEVLFTEELVVVVRRPNPLSRKEYISVAELSALPLVLYDQSTSMRKRLDGFFQEMQVAPRVILELSSVETMKRMVEAGLGATIVPSSAMLGSENRKHLHALRIRDKPLTRDVGMAVPSVPRLPRVVDAMLDLIRQRFQEIRLLLDR
jgi:DNA-binding transcriptional LysR family regulator